MFKLLDELRLNPSKTRIQRNGIERTQISPAKHSQPLQSKNQAVVLTGSSRETDPISEY